MEQECTGREPGCRTRVLGSRGIQESSRYTLSDPFLLPLRGPLRPEEVGLREYEVMFILPAEADESAVTGVTDRITKVIGEGGAVGNVDRWGRRRLAYEIDKQNEGYYVIAQFTADPSVITEVERTLKLADEVIRFKVVVRAA